MTHVIQMDVPDTTKGISFRHAHWRQGFFFAAD